MAEQDKNDIMTQTPDAQDPLAHLGNGDTMPMSPPSMDATAITREASNIARELRTLAHRVESFKIKFAR